MHVRENLKPLIPRFLHPVLRPLKGPVSKSAISALPPTKFPLDPKVRDAIGASLRKSMAAGIETPAPRSFPDVDELKSYWGIVRGITELLEPVNPDDKYFNWTHLQDHRRRGLLDISKDLFAIWVAVNQRPKLILEIGCRTGKSIATQLFIHPDRDACTCLLVDLFVEMGSPELIQRNLAHLRIPTSNVHAFVGYSESVFPQLMKELSDVRFDYVLVDGSHEREPALTDLNMVAPYVAKGGYVVFDDIGSYGPGVGYGLIEVWNVWKAEHQQAFEFQEYPAPWGFAAARRR